MLLSLITLLLAATNAIARPWTAAAATGPSEDIPWQIYNLSLRALSSNTTHSNATQYISFTVVDLNEGLSFNTTCNRTIPTGQSLFQESYTRCAFRDAAFSLRGDGKLYFQRRFGNSQPWPHNVTTCSGFTDLTQAEYYSNGSEGMVAVDSHLEIACTFQNGRIRK